MPHCPLTKAAPLSPLKLRCEKPTLLHIHCSYLKYVFVLVPPKSLAAVSIPEPRERRGSGVERVWWVLFPCGLELGQAHGWAKGSINLHLLCSPLYLGTEEPSQALRDTVQPRICADSWEMPPSGMNSVLWWVFALNNRVSSKKIAINSSQWLLCNTALLRVVKVHRETGVWN